MNWAPGDHQDFCGTKGICCRSDELKSSSSGCSYGMGERGEHTCTKQGSAPEYANLGDRACWGKCGEGRCSYCGTRGLCCRHNVLKNRNSGCKNKGDPDKGYHHCVKP